MKEIVKRLQEDRNIERAKQIMESNGYKVTKNKLTESYDKEFWKLHDKDYDTGIALEDIIDKLGLADKFFVEDDNAEPTATEEEYKKVLDKFKGDHREEFVAQEEYDDTVRALRELGFTENWVEYRDGSASYYVKGSVGILIDSPAEIKILAKHSIA